jgi:transcriptional regulator with XRE-family HTH domain
MTSEVMSGRPGPGYPIFVASPAPSTPTAFGTLLRRHRTQRGMSQERLAREAEISTRHLSCLETGRAAPSRMMVLVLGSALDVTLRDRNAMLEAAGFIAAYRDEPLDAPEAAALRRAVDLVLQGVEPNGAIAVDRSWNLLQMNGAAGRLMGAFLDIGNAPPEVMKNVLVATLHPLGFRPYIVNFEECAALIMDRAKREAARTPDDPVAAEVRALVEAIPDVPQLRTMTSQPAGPFLTVHMRRNGVEARFFTTISTIGTPIDATAEEIRIETYFPADEATAQLMKALAAASA